MRSSAGNVTLDVADEVALCYDDPLRFVCTMYPWGEPGPLAQYSGPDHPNRRYCLGSIERSRLS